VTGLNATHAPALRSWVACANRDGADFPIQNLPFAVFQVKGDHQAPRCGVGIGDAILDVGACADLFEGQAAAAAQACRMGVLNDLMAMGPAAASALRARLSELLGADHAQHRETLTRALYPLDAVELRMPARIGGFTDFFASIHHATNAGRLFRPDAPLLPNYKYVPIAYNGRANSVRVSGSPLQRPWGQIRVPDQEGPVFAPSRRLDYEVELGMFVGAPSAANAPVSVADAWKHIFGFSLLNDWSARDIQSWEYQPLGPFLAKSFATTVAPWVITAEALAPFRVAAAIRAEGDPAPMPHLLDATDQSSGNLQIVLDASLRTRRMREQGIGPLRLSRSSADALYWTFAQMLSHHTSNGSALDTGDLLGSGTISADAADGLGSLLEITAGGTRPLHIGSTDEQRSFLQDGDELSLTARCTREGFVSIGFGTCTGVLDAARPAPV
jgi:fumarylacetoacetase